MPKIKISHVVSFSSEDPLHNANNLLSSDPSKKWKCQNVGEKAATVVLQLEKASEISSIDIGNEGSAYVEVLVARSSNSEDFKVLLVMSSFMTPVEARQSININKVRMFGKDMLSKPECNEKWDRVKIVCTQPFNRHVQYGLSFITFHSIENKDTSTAAPISLGKFALRPASPDNLSVGSLFARRKELKDPEPATAAAAIRQATNATTEPSNTPLTPKLKHSIKTPNKTKATNAATPQPRNRNEILYSQDEEAPNAKIDKLVEQKNLENKKLKEETEKTETPKKTETKKDKKVKDAAQKENRIETPKRNTNKPSTSDSGHKRKQKETEKVQNKRVKANRRTKPFEKLFEGVVFVISGIANPDRANLRSSALAMGAKYKADWDNSCTHLICAFVNTPKFNQVKGKGKIVTRKWIEDSAAQRKRLPWRRYALDRNDQGEESEEEIWAEIPETSSNNNTLKDSDTESFSGQFDEKEDASDTELEVARIQKLMEKRNKQSGNNEDEFSADTEEEILEKPKKTTVKELPSFFSNKSFYIDTVFKGKERELLQKYIAAYNGIQLEDDSKVDIVITTDNAEIAHKNKTQSKYVTADWIWACHNEQKLLPYDDFMLD